MKTLGNLLLNRLLNLRLKIWNFWPPFWGAGISIVRLVRVGEAIQSIEVKLKRRFWTSNYVGTQFGGSLFAMTDPFYMVILISRLGRDFVVWDKSAKIRFRRPARTECRAEFAVTDQELGDICSQVEREGKMDWIRKVEIFDREGTLVAEVEKIIYIAKKAQHP